MAPVSVNHKYLKELRGRLEGLGYDLGLRMVLGPYYNVHPAWAARSELARLIRAFPPDLQAAYRLFLLGQPVARSKSASVLSAGVLQDLLQGEFLRRKGPSIETRGGQALIAFRGKYLWVDDPGLLDVPADERVYVGWHSYLFMSHMRPVAGGRALDIGTGSGLLALFCADQSRSVVATDIDPKAVRMAEVNAAMNGLEGSLEVRHGDLFSGVWGERFDYICANTPCIPVPLGLTFPRWAAGGKDGLDFLRRITAELPDYLAPGGRCQIVTTTPILRDRSCPLDGLVARLRDSGYRCLLQLFHVHRVRDVVRDSRQTLARYYAESPASVTRKWLAHFQQMGATALCTAILTLERPVSSQGAGSLRVIGPFYQAGKKRKGPSSAPWLHRLIGKAILAKVEPNRAHLFEAELEDGHD